MDTEYTEKQIEQFILEEMKDREHAEHSPSSLKLKALCGSFRQDPNSSKVAADRGTLGHKAVELENTDILPQDDEELIEAVENCIFYLNQIRESYGQPHGEKKPLVIPHEFLTKEKKEEVVQALLPKESSPKKEETVIEIEAEIVEEMPKDLETKRYGQPSNVIENDEIEYF
jgi:hypothetical protein